MLDDQNIECELSYAYIHAIASRSGFSCSQANRHEDNAGIDVYIRSENKFLDANSKITSLQLQLQLKATIKAPVEANDKLPHSIKVKQYNKLRSITLGQQRLLVVYYLPREKEEWLNHTENALVTKRCAYWVSLRGAPDVNDQDNVTVYIPRSQILSHNSLMTLMISRSKEEWADYES